MKIVVSIGLIFIFTFVGFAQPSKYARRVVKTICSPKFKGRGYTGGDIKTVEWLEKALKKQGISKIGTNYRQPFSFSVNTFPNVADVEINGRKLKKHQYILASFSGSSKGVFQVVELNKNLPLKCNILDQKKAYYIDKSIWNVDLKTVFELSKYAPVIVKQKEKLTASIAQFSTKYAVVFLSNEVDVPKVVKLDIQNEQKTHTSYNVIGKIKGVDTTKSIVFSAHFDHLGQMGDAIYFPGANDNASGVAMLLALGRYYAKNKPPYNVVLMFFSGEEVGLLGSKHYVEHPVFPLKNIKFLVNLDIVGTGDNGIQVVAGDVFKTEFTTMKTLNDDLALLPEVKVRGQTKNSDHYPFYLKGVKGFFIYTLGGSKAYHDVWDTSKNLSLKGFDDLFQLLTHFVDAFVLEERALIH